MYSYFITAILGMRDKCNTVLASTGCEKDGTSPAFSTMKFGVMQLILMKSKGWSKSTEIFLDEVQL